MHEGRPDVRVYRKIPGLDLGSAAATVPGRSLPGAARHAEHVVHGMIVRPGASLNHVYNRRDNSATGSLFVEGTMDGLIERACAQIAAGKLPAGHWVHTEGGSSRRRAVCAVCEDLIAPGSPEIELRWAGASVLLHPRCHSAWILAVREFAGH